MNHAADNDADAASASSSGEPNGTDGGPAAEDGPPGKQCSGSIAAVTNGLVARYEFHGGSLADATGQHGAATASKVISTAANRFGCADDALELQPFDSLTVGAFPQLQSGLTIHLWEHRIELTSVAELMSNGHAGPGTGLVALVHRPSTRLEGAAWYLAGSLQAKVVDNDALTATWHHVAVRITPGSTSSPEVFIDGVSSGVAPGSLGTFDFSASSALVWHFGDATLHTLIDDVRFYNRELSNQEIAALFAEPPGP
jgi:hypothetical protein